jgi:hypothetical protein
MPLHPNVRRCSHIQVTGHRCGSPALKQEYFCYFHTRMIKGVQTRVDAQIHPIALIENAEAIQAALMHMIDAVLKGTIDNKRANIVLKALHIAVRNSRNVYFHIRQDDMVREVPNYAEQYLSEHPELNPTEPHPPVAPDALVRGTEQSAAELSQALSPDHPPRERASRQQECHPEEAQGFAKRRPANEGSMHSQSEGNVAASPRHPSKGNCEKAWGENTPPLTNRQSERNHEIKKLEASIENARHGDWRELRTVFNAVGLTPPSLQASSAPKPRGKLSGTQGFKRALNARISTEIRPEP